MIILTAKCPFCGSDLAIPTFWCSYCNCDSNGNPNSVEAATVKAIESELRSAFSGVTLHGGVTIEEANEEDFFLEESSGGERRKREQEESWSDVPATKIESMFPSLFGFDANGWKYYLPAFMCWVLKCWRSSSSPTPEWLVSTLTRKRGVRDHFAVLNLTQSKAVFAFLSYCRMYFDEKTALEAIESYWRQFED